MGNNTGLETQKYEKRCPKPGNLGEQPIWGYFSLFLGAIYFRTYLFSYFGQDCKTQARMRASSGTFIDRASPLREHFLKYPNFLKFSRACLFHAHDCGRSNVHHAAVFLHLGGCILELETTSARILFLQLMGATPTKQAHAHLQSRLAFCLTMTCSAIHTSECRAFLRASSVGNEKAAQSFYDRSFSKLPCMGTSWMSARECFLKVFMARPKFRPQMTQVDVHGIFGPITSLLGCSLFVPESKLGQDSQENFGQDLGLQGYMSVTLHSNNV